MLIELALRAKSIGWFRASPDPGVNDASRDFIDSIWAAGPKPAMDRCLEERLHSDSLVIHTNRDQRCTGTG